MIDLNFNCSTKNNLGVELELILVDSDTLLPTSRPNLIFENISSEFIPFIHPEFFQNMLEISSPIFNHVDEIEPFFVKILAHINSLGEKFGISAIAMGTHPLLYQKDALITKNDRYKRLHTELQGILNRFLIMGMHIHVSMKSKEQAVNACNMANYYLPTFLALSTSSPFFEGENTGLHSYRSKIFESLPRGGIPEYIRSYEDFSNLVLLLNKHKSVKAFNEIWWDIRIRPDFGTLELRVCDSINDINRIQAITAFFQALCLYAEDHKQPYFFHQISKQNKWSAVRHSMAGKFIEEKQITTIKEKSFKLLNILDNKNYFQMLNTTKYIDNIKQYIEGTPISTTIVDIYNKTSNFKDVIKEGVISK